MTDDDQPELFDQEEAQRAKEEGMEKAERGATAQWKAQALDAIYAAARANKVFTTDAVWAILYRFDAVPREPKALGPMMKKANGQGWIAPTSDYRASVRKRAHGAPKRVWRSLVFEGGA